MTVVSCANAKKHETSVDGNGSIFDFKSVLTFSRYMKMNGHKPVVYILTGKRSNDAELVLQRATTNRVQSSADFNDFQSTVYA